MTRPNQVPVPVPQGPQSTYAMRSPQPAETSDSVVFAFHGSMEARKNPMIGTLVGEYREAGSNHGRNYYRKVQGAVRGHEVYLYYWDDRDGPALNGWWFGNMVGGREVWGRAQESSPTPPPGGWNIPWDSKDEADFLVMNAEGKRAHDQRLAQEEQELTRQAIANQQREQKMHQFADRLNPVREKVQASEEAINTAIEAARDNMKAGCPAETITTYLEDIVKQRNELTVTQRLVMQEGNFINRNAPELKGDMVQMAGRIRHLSAQIQEALNELEKYKHSKVREEYEAKAKEEEEARQKADEEEMSTKIGSLMEATWTAITDAEDEVEKVSIAAAPLDTDTGDEMEAVLEEAVAETEQRYKVAMAALVEAKKIWSTGKAGSTRLPASMKEEMAGKVGEQETKLKALEGRLSEFKTLRKDYQQRTQDIGAINELTEKAVGAEVSLEQASASALETVDDIREVEKAAAAAQSVSNQAMKSLTTKFPAVSKPPDEEKRGDMFSPVLRLARELKGRIESIQDIAGKKLQAAKDSRVRIITAALMTDVSAKMQPAEQALKELSGPGWAMVDNFPEDEAEKKTAYAEADALVVKTNQALSDAQAFVARKLAEAMRLTAGSAKNDATEEIGKLNSRLKEGRDQLEEFKNHLWNLRTQGLFKEVESAADETGKCIQRLVEAAAEAKECLMIGETPIDKLQEMLDEVNEAEKEAKISVAGSMKVLTLKTAEVKKIPAKSGASGAELGKLHTRLSGMQEEIIKLASSVKESREKAHAKEMLKELISHTKGAESEVQRILETAAPLWQAPMDDDEEAGPDEDALHDFDSGCEGAMQKLNTTAKLVDLKLRNATGYLKEELETMRQKLTDAEEQLISLSSKVQEVKERSQVTELLNSVSTIIKKAEASVQECTDAEKPFESGIENMAAEKLAVALSHCEAKSPGAGQAVADAQAALAGTLMEAQNLSEGSAKKCRLALSEMQTRMERMSSRIGEFRSTLEKRTKASRGKMLIGMVEAVESAVKKLDVAVKKIGSSETDPAEKGLLCEEITEAEQVAQKAMGDARQYVQSQLLEVRTLAGEERKKLTMELSAKQTRLTQLQAELTKVGRQGSQFVQRIEADNVLQDSTESLNKLQAEMDSATKVAAPLLASDRSDMLQELRFHSLMQGLQDYMHTAGGPESLFAKIAVTDNTSASLAEFVAFIETLPDLVGREDLVFSEEQASGILSAIGGEDSSLSIDQFKIFLSEHYVCSQSGSLVAGAGDLQEAGSLEPGEVLRIMRQEEQEGTTYAECTLGRDASTAWVVLEKQNGDNGSAQERSGNSPILELRSSEAWQLESIEAFVNGCHGRCVEAVEALNQITEKIMAAKEGPLAAVKGKLMTHRMKVSAVQSKTEQLTKRVATAKAAVLQQRQEEIKTLQEARVKKQAMKMVQAAAKVLEDAEAKVPEVTDAIKNRSAETLQKELDSSELDALKTVTDDAVQAFLDAKAMIAKASKAQEDGKMLLEVRLELTKLNSRVTTSERRCRSVIEPVTLAHQRVVGEIVKEAQSKLRAAARAHKKTSDELYDDFAKLAAKMTEEQFSSLVKSLPELNLSEYEISLFFRQFTEGLSRLELASVIQEFMVCDSPTTLTEAFDIGATATLRKVEPGELFEILDSLKAAADSEVQRAPVRAIADGVTGWVTVSGNKGKIFMRNAEKPILICDEEVDLQREFADQSPVVRSLRVEEEFELLEGPREEIVPGEVHVQGTCAKDGASGWITLKDSAGTEYASATVGSYKCKSMTALTDGPDTKKCKVVRRIEVGEILEVLDDEKQGDQPAEGAALRLRFKALKDGKEGWVTIKGSRGTAFLEAQSQYSVKKSVMLRKTVSPDSEEVREVEEGEAFKATGVPKEDKPGRRVGVRVRCMGPTPGKGGKKGTQRSEGWVVHQGGGGSPPLRSRGEPLPGW